MFKPNTEPLEPIIPKVERPPVEAPAAVVAVSVYVFFVLNGQDYVLKNARILEKSAIPALSLKLTVNSIDFHSFRILFIFFSQ